jgi:hypothetical protein
MIDDIDERVLVLHERHRTARKEHKCGECRRVIHPGESYMVERYISDHRAESHKTCQHCQVAREWLLHECHGFMYGFIGEDITEHVQEGCYGVDLKIVDIGIQRRWHRKDGSLWRVPKLPKVSGPAPTGMEFFATPS